MTFKITRDLTEAEWDAVAEVARRHDARMGDGSLDDLIKISLEVVNAFAEAIDQEARKVKVQVDDTTRPSGETTLRRELGRRRG